MWAYWLRTSPGKKAAYFLSPAEALEWKHNDLYWDSESWEPGLRVFTVDWLAFGSRKTERGNVHVWAGKCQAVFISSDKSLLLEICSSSTVCAYYHRPSKCAICIRNIEKLEKKWKIHNMHICILKNQCVLCLTSEAVIQYMCKNIRWRFKLIFVLML